MLVSHQYATNLSSSLSLSLSICFQIENLLEQLKDKDKQLAGLKERVQGLQTDSSNTDTALATLEEALSEKVQDRRRYDEEGEDGLVEKAGGQEKLTEPAGKRIEVALLVAGWMV